MKGSWPVRSHGGNAIFHELPATIQLLRCQNGLPLNRQTSYRVNIGIQKRDTTAKPRDRANTALLDNMECASDSEEGKCGSLTMILPRIPSSNDYSTACSPLSLLINFDTPRRTRFAKIIHIPQIAARVGIRT